MNEGLITFTELIESWEAGNENLLTFAGGAAIALLTSFPDKLAHSKWGRWFGLGGLVFFAAACGPSVATAPVAPEITPIPPTPTLVAPGEDIMFHLDVNTESRDFGLSSNIMDAEVLDSLYPGAMARLRELGFDPNAMDFIQYMVSDGRGENENYLIAQNPLTGEMVMPWEISTDGWGTIDPSNGSGTRYEWSKVAVEQGEDGAFSLTTFNGRYFVLGRGSGLDGKWSAGLPALDKNTKKNVRLGEVRGGGGMLFAPAEMFKLMADGGSEEYAGAEFTPTAAEQVVTETPTPEPASTPIAETLLPPGFVVKDRMDLDKIVPYCFPRVDFTGGAESNLKLLNEMKASGFYQFLLDRMNRNEIDDFAPTMIDTHEGSVCGVVIVWKKVNGQSVRAGVYFQSKLTQEWVELEFAEPK